MSKNIVSYDVHKTYDSASQDYPDRMPYLGQKQETKDGREYVFCSSVVNVAAGLVVAAPVVIAELDGVFTAASEGDTSVTLTSALLSAVTADEYKDGTLLITESCDVKRAYTIKSNTAVSSNAVTFTLYEGLAGDVAATDAAFIRKFKYKTVVLGSTQCAPIGVAVTATTAATDGAAGTTDGIAYFWAQTKGIGGVKVATEANCIDSLAAVCAASGEAELAATDSQYYPIGIFLPTAAVAAGDLCPIELML